MCEVVASLRRFGESFSLLFYTLPSEIFGPLRTIPVGPPANMSVLILSYVSSGPKSIVFCCLVMLETIFVINVMNEKQNDD